MNIAVILAGGNNNKFLIERAKFPKQFYETCRKEIISYTLSTFNKHSLIDKIVIVTNIEDIDKTNQLINEKNYDKVIGVVPGGITRQASVYSAIHFLNKLDDIGNSNIIIHDAARMFVSQETITKLIKLLDDYDAVTTYSLIRENLGVSSDGNRLEKQIDNKDMYVIHTPQGFKLDTLRSAHKYAQALNISDAKDDTQLMKLLNKEVYMVRSNYENSKITTEEDLIMLKHFFKDINLGD